MNTINPQLTKSKRQLVTDELLELQLCVARRADELSRGQKTADKLNLECWLKAEAEVIGQRIGIVPKVRVGIDRLVFKIFRHSDWGYPKVGLGAHGGGPSMSGIV